MLEDMDILFGTVDAEIRVAGVERVLHKEMAEHHELEDVGTKAPVAESIIIKHADPAPINEKTVS
jgi:hypothetical protein